MLRIRGSYMSPGEKVYASVPASLPPLPDDAPANRLGLARWLASDENPLTARVTVNRAWEAFFGHGIVETSEDFGRQGEQPTHPARPRRRQLVHLRSPEPHRRLSLYSPHQLVRTYRGSYESGARTDGTAKDQEGDNVHSQGRAGRRGCLSHRGGTPRDTSGPG
jgi:hypothetical protein